MSDACALIDSHCHLNFLESPVDCVQRAQDAGVDGILCIGVDADSSAQAARLAAQHPGVWASAGLHPESAAKVPFSLERADWLPEALARAGVVAVGETGLDFFHNATETARQRQCAWFAEHLKLSVSTGLPIVVHTRDAKAETLALIEDSGCTRGVLHCFTEDAETAERALALGFYISFSGIVTFKNADALREVARVVPRARLLIETDAPWLAPVPHRGKTNEPAYLPHTLAVLASLRGESERSLGVATRENFFRLFSGAA